MKFQYIFGILFIGLFLFGCVSPNTETTTEYGVTTTNTKTPTTQTISWTDGNATGTITKNLLTNEATVEYLLKYPIPKDNPATGYINEETIAKGVVKGFVGQLLPKMFVTMFFDYAGFEERQKSSDLNILGGAGSNTSASNSTPARDMLLTSKVILVKIKLIEQETGNPIYDFSATSTNEKDWQYIYYGEYKDNN